MSELEQQREAAEVTSLPVEWHVPDDTRSQYANNVLVQSTPHEIVVSFFEAQLPPLVGTAAENAAKIKEIGHVRANLVARIVVAPGLLPSIIDALQTGLDTYIEAYGSKREE